MNYTPINYKKWDRTGIGKNILHLLTASEQAIWTATFPYQDSRPHDKGHIEVVTYFALEMLKLVPEAQREIVLPATIMHDIGWSQLPQEVRDLFKDPYVPDFKKANDPVIRKRHQDESVRLALQILTDCNYPSKYQKDILDIIGDHDTRKHFTGIDAHVMGDADVLWRFTVIECDNYGWKPKDFIARMKRNVKKEKYLLTAAGRAIAKMELKNTEAYYG